MLQNTQYMLRLQSRITFLSMKFSQLICKIMEKFEIENIIISLYIIALKIVTKQKHDITRFFKYMNKAFKLNW